MYGMKTYREVEEEVNGGGKQQRGRSSSLHGVKKVVKISEEED
jgi:hypothetical protein